MGWDELRLKQTFERQKKMGIIPQNAVLNPSPNNYKKWDSLSPEMKKVAAREMECYAAALAYADNQIGRVVDSIEEMGELDNTLVIYIMGDNGSSTEDPYRGRYDQRDWRNGQRGQGHTRVHAEEHRRVRWDVDAKSLLAPLNNAMNTPHRVGQEDRFPPGRIKDVDGRFLACED